MALGCGSSGGDTRHEQILGVAETERWLMPALARPVHVVRTESHVPHIYASSRRDLAFVQGFVMARDRYFMMDLARRLGLGTISELLGADALDVDQESRGIGMTYVAEQIAKGLTPELASYVDAFAEGINVYIERVKGEELPAPSELGLAKILLGAPSASELMAPFDRLSVSAMVAVVLYQTSYETGDVGRSLSEASLDTLFEGAPFEAQRRAGARQDLFDRIEPVVPTVSAPGFGASQTKQGVTSLGPVRRRLPVSLLLRLSKRLARINKRLGRDTDAGFGSNAWAVAADHTTNGRALLAGDGHLSLAVPSILYQLGLDTEVFGRGTTHQLGLIIAGFPVMPIGTNGRVAWSQTQLMGDVTDWYSEEVELDADGLPSKSRFQGAWHALERVEETYVVADVPALDSVGRSEIWPRFTTFDGR
jgi:penicillin amidase